VAAWRSLFDLLPDLQYVDVNHFPPYHGHGVVDVNFGRLKRELRHHFLDMGAIHPEEAINFFSTLENTNVRRVPSNTKPSQHIYRAWHPGISSWRRFTLELEADNIKITASAENRRNMGNQIVFLQVKSILYRDNDDRDLLPQPPQQAVQMEGNMDIEKFGDIQDFDPLDPPDMDQDIEQHHEPHSDNSNQWVLPTGETRTTLARRLNISPTSQHDLARVIGSVTSADRLRRYLSSIGLGHMKIEEIITLWTEQRGTYQFVLDMENILKAGNS
jgi:hypothetical protein